MSQLLILRLTPPKLPNSPLAMVVHCDGRIILSGVTPQTVNWVGNSDLSDLIQVIEKDGRLVAQTASFGELGEGTMIQIHRSSYSIPSHIFRVRLPDQRTWGCLAVIQDNEDQPPIRILTEATEMTAIALCVFEAMVIPYTPPTTMLTRAGFNNVQSLTVN